MHKMKHSLFSSWRPGWKYIVTLYSPCVPSWQKNNNQKCRPGICNPGRSHDLVPGRSHDQSSWLFKIKNKNIIKNKTEIWCHIGCLFNLTCIFNLWCKINLQIYWSNKRNLLSKLRELGWVTENQVQTKQWQTWSKSADTVIIWQRMALKLKHNISQENVNLLSC